MSVTSPPTLSAPSSVGCSPAGSADLASSGVEVHCGVLALEGRRRSRLELVLKVRGKRLQGGLGDEDVVPGLSGDGFDTGRGVDRVPDDGEVAPPATANGSGDDPSGVDADADPQSR